MTTALCISGRPPAKGTLRLLAVCLLLPLAAPAAADGEFLQFDYAPRASSLTATMQRDRLTLTLGWSEFATGHATSLWVSHGIRLGDAAWLRVGPSLRVDNTGDGSFGLRAGVERYAVQGRRGLFLLAEVNSIQREYLALAQLGDQPTGLAGEVVVQGNDSGFREHSVAVSFRLGEGPARLRAGYRFESRQPFIGFSLNTF